MDIFDEELLKFWSLINQYHVRYIMIGGVAVNLNGYSRTTDDIDVWLEDNPENRKNFRIAFSEYSSVDYFMLDYMQIIPGWTYFNLNNGLRLDLMLDVKGLENYSFDECLSMASTADIDGVVVPFLHINHLIASKKAANRPQDQDDILALEKIKKFTSDDNAS